MSGEGAAVAPRMQHAHLSLPYWDPTNGCEPVAEAERQAMVDHIRRKIEVAKRFDTDGHLVRVLDEIVEDLSRGLHLA